MSRVYADLDEIVFEGREKDYGAYQMRKEYNRTIERSALLGCLLFLFMTGFPKVLPWILPEKVEEVNMLDVTPVQLSDLPPPPSIDEEEAPPPPPDVKAPPPVRATIEFKVPKPTPDEEVKEDETIAEMTEVEEVDPGLETQEGDPNAQYDFGEIDGAGSGPVEVVEAPKEEEIGPSDFVALEKEPAPVNLEDIKKLIGYPTMAKEAEIEGKVTVRVQVDKTGKYVKHVVLKDPHPILTKAVVDKLPQLAFTPGIQAGKPIKVWVTIPFDFKLLR
jgi:periplasmic protein TonB